MIYRRAPLCLFLFLIYFMVGIEARSEEMLTKVPETTGMKVGLEVSPESESGSEITGISVREVDNFTEIHIESDSLLSYTMYKPEDPYRVIVELQDVGLGKFRDKLVIDKAGVMEIIPSRGSGDIRSSKLEIVLTVPADVKPVQKSGALILTFYNPESGATVLASEKETPEAEGEAVLPGEDEGIALVYSEEGSRIIKNIELIKSDDKVKVIISGNSNMSPEVFQVDANKLIVDIPDVSTTVQSLKTYEPPVLGVRVGESFDKTRTRIAFDITENATYAVSVVGNDIIVSFDKSGKKVTKEVIPPPAEKEPARDKPFVSKKYVGKKISLDFQDADIIHIFRLLADVSGYNIVVSPEVEGRFSMKLIDIPWDQSLDVILRNYGLSKTVEDNIIRIASTATLAQEEEAIARAKESQEKAGDLITKVYPINFASVADIKKTIETAKLLTKRGFISIDKRTSSVIIKDVDKKHAEYERIISVLDKPTAQVSIEAKIVEVTTNFTKELGIQWGSLWNPPDSRTTFGGTTTSGGTGFNSSNPLLVNLPAAVGSGAGGVIGIGFISASNTFTLDLQLSAMESSGKGRIVSDPKITTMDNQEAKIQQGKLIPYQGESEGGGTTTEFVDANLELIVTPHITPDGTIVMDIEAKKNEPDFSRTVNNTPTIDTKEIKTQVLIKDGDTLVIGGIFKTTTTRNFAGVPALSKIPLLGWLFKNNVNTEETSELLIFITPRIIKKQDMY